MPDELKPVLAREMEVYAGFLEHVDFHVGRLIDTIDDLGVLDNTIVYYIIGDNGASAEGTLNGAFNEMANFNGMAALETPEFMMSKVDEFGSPTSYNHYAVGWAWAMDTPFQWTKQIASHWGGTRNGTIVHWPDDRTSERIEPTMAGRSTLIRGDSQLSFPNVLGIHEFGTEADQVTPAGKHQVRMEFAYDGGLAKGGDVTLFYDG